jgi:hypothetical protein
MSKVALFDTYESKHKHSLSSAAKLVFDPESGSSISIRKENNNNQTITTSNLKNSITDFSIKSLKDGFGNLTQTTTVHQLVKDKTRDHTCKSNQLMTVNETFYLKVNELTNGSNSRIQQIARRAIVDPEDLIVIRPDNNLKLNDDSPTSASRKLHQTVSQKHITIGGYNFNDPKFHLLINDEMVITKNHESENQIPRI